MALAASEGRPGNRPEGWRFAVPIGLFAIALFLGSRFYARPSIETTLPLPGNSAPIDPVIAEEMERFLRASPDGKTYTAAPISLNVSLNGHARERRGPDLAAYINDIVHAAFRNPNDDNKKGALCGQQIGPDGVARNIATLMVEVASRATLGAIRTAQIIVLQVDGVWRMVTTLYTSESLSQREEDERRRLDIVNLGPCPPGVIAAILVAP